MLLLYVVQFLYDYSLNGAYHANTTLRRNVFRISSVSYFKPLISPRSHAVVDIPFRLAIIIIAVWVVHVTGYSRPMVIISVCLIVHPTLLPDARSRLLKIVFANSIAMYMMTTILCIMCRQSTVFGENK